MYIYIASSFVHNITLCGTECRRPSTIDVDILSVTCNYVCINSYLPCSGKPLKELILEILNITEISENLNLKAKIQQ